ncbi:hypothetical protein [Methylocystis hirsuta]|uniref:Uncharacterized protein n=1 Tax=Methylocystis hirsuta TaxID=369798 RepID=A0A3M9XT92_9HYPH|nr:hypothetical protein [Methylocystis hirsuta]RNJ50328.1 hypothetical protein D1O30_12705 [Methylocystis hirsuta]
MTDLYDGLTLVALSGIAGSIFKFGYELKKDGVKRRSDLYDDLRKEFDGGSFDNIFTALDDYDTAVKHNPAGSLPVIQAEISIRSLPLNDKYRFAAFIEHVALVTNSGIISYPLANYAFGEYARLGWNCAPFWDDLCDTSKQKDPYWAMYQEFVAKLQPAAEALNATPSKAVAKIRF